MASFIWEKYNLRQLLAMTNLCRRVRRARVDLTLFRPTQQRQFSFFFCSQPRFSFCLQRFVPIFFYCWTRVFVRLDFFRPHYREYKNSHSTWCLVCLRLKRFRFRFFRSNFSLALSVHQVNWGWWQSARVRVDNILRTSSLRSLVFVPNFRTN